MKDIANSETDGCNILVIEDDYIVALDLCAHLESLGFHVIGPAGKMETGLTLARTAALIDGALLDVNISGQMVFPVADALIERNIPITFLTAYDPSMLPKEYRHIPRVAKPMDTAELSRAIRQMCGDKIPSMSAQP